jgi:hypothetical protein
MGAQMRVKKHPCSCWENCDKFSEGSGTTPDGEEWPMYYCKGERMRDEYIDHAEKCGCISHPKAREYLCQCMIDRLKLYKEQSLNQFSSADVIQMIDKFCKE